MSENLYKINSMYYDKLQQDSGEFLNNFLNYLKQNCVAPLNPVAKNIEFTIVETHICEG